MSPNRQGDKQTNGSYLSIDVAIVESVHDAKCADCNSSCWVPEVLIVLIVPNFCMTKPPLPALAPGNFADGKEQGQRKEMTQAEKLVNNLQAAQLISFHK